MLEKLSCLETLVLRDPSNHGACQVVCVARRVTLGIQTRRRRRPLLHMLRLVRLPMETFSIGHVHVALGSSLLLEGANLGVAVGQCVCRVVHSCVFLH